MPSPLRLDVFEIADVPEGPALLTPEQIEELRLTAYERGYVAGYDDAGQQAEAEAAARRARVAAAIEGLSFGYHEARAHLLAGLEPLLRAMAEVLLPEIARAAVVPLVIEQLMPLTATAADTPLVLRVPPGQRADYLAAFQGLVLPPLTLVEAADLAEGQAEIACGADETRIDLTHAAARIAEALAAFHHHEESRRA